MIAEGRNNKLWSSVGYSDKHVKLQCKDCHAAANNHRSLLYRRVIAMSCFSSAAAAGDENGL